jgi:hypothetical protein
LLAAPRRPDSDSVDPTRSLDQDDRCRFQLAFNRDQVACSAFQPLTFVAATSYGRPLGTHVACVHLQVGESARNQFYARCALGGDRDRERWVAGVGPGGIEVVRALMAEFESIAIHYRDRLIAAKATVNAQGAHRTGPAHDELAVLVSRFLDDVDAFVALHAVAIAETGMVPASLCATMARALNAWQANDGLDLPSIEEHWIGRADPEVALDAATSTALPGLHIATDPERCELRLTGQIDESNLAALNVALDAAVSAGSPVAVEMSGVTFCSVGGLRLLATGVKRGELRLAGVPAHLHRALAAAGLTQEPEAG